jgi:hypothetical protein
VNDDVLARAARALRETRGGAPAGPSAGRGRVLALAVTRRRRRLRVIAVLVPLAAVLVLSTAWAATTGRMRSFFEGLVRSGAPEVHGSAVVASPPPAPLPSPSAAPPPTAPSRAPDEDDAGSSIDVLSLPVAPPRASQAATRPAPTADAAANVEEDLYAVAHHAHFVSRDPGAALKAWDAYLAAYPRGRFALEARYNRALSLVRLGRAAEARQALAPFADGSLGGYRRHEAGELLEVLGGDASP